MPRFLWGSVLLLYVFAGAIVTTHLFIVRYALRPDSVAAFAVFAVVFVVGFASFLRITFR